MNWRQSPSRDERGAVLLTVLMSMITLLAIAALVLDLAAVRVNRAVSQTVADAAAAAGALDTEGQDGRAGCETALDYLELNLPDVGSFTGGDCLAFPTSCDIATTSVSTSVSAGNWIATITYPVDDASPLLQPSTIGNPGQALHPDDGDRCDRFAVSMQSSYNYSFGRLLGANSQTSEIHTVARSFQPEGSDFALNLLVLERYDCNALRSGGGGSSNGGILVDAVFNPDTGQLDNGYIAVDSDASGSCGGNGVIDTNGSNAFIRADGAAGCAGEIGTHTGPGGLLVGEGCGQIQLIAPGVPGCNYPACTNGGTISPDPTPRSERVTRAPVDHIYNCKSSYSMPSGWAIDGCSDPAAPHIDDLVSALGGSGTPSSFTTWTSAGYGCKDNGLILVPAGNWYINCNNFAPKGAVIFQGGDVVFKDRVTLNSNAILAVNANPALPFPFSPAGDDSVVYVRDGAFSKGAQASLVLHHTTVYVSETASIGMSGGSGSVIWSGPIAGDFENLALWSETSATTAFSGGAGLDLDGVFFAPWSEISYQGNGAQVQVSAQFIARRLSTGGNGVLVVRPDFSRAVLFPFDPQSQLIR